jgi:thymidylate synthase (FAD)
MKEFKLLDHGYLRFIESYGSDESIIEAARMSTNKGFLGWGDPLPPCGYCGQSELFKSKANNAGEGGYQCRNCNGRLSLDPNAIPKPGDEKLLAYLYENKHATPFEMAGLIIEVQAPIFVFREWHR